MIDFFINGAPVVNAILILLLVFMGAQNKNFPLLMFFFIYCSLHYAFSVPAIFFRDLDTLGMLHNTSNVGALITQAIFFLVWTLFVVKYNGKEN